MGKKKTRVWYASRQLLSVIVTGEFYARATPFCNVDISSRFNFQFIEMKFVPQQSFFLIESISTAVTEKIYGKGEWIIYLLNSFSSLCVWSLHLYLWQWVHQLCVIYTCQQYRPMKVIQQWHGCVVLLLFQGGLPNNKEPYNGASPMQK